VIEYETELKTDGFLVTADGPAAEIVRAKILGTVNPSRIDVYSGDNYRGAAAAAVG
jgi:hypothetical protein